MTKLLVPAAVMALVALGAAAAMKPGTFAFDETLDTPPGTAIAIEAFPWQADMSALQGRGFEDLR